MEIKLYDTTLRDGTQSEDVNFTADEKIMMSKLIDDLGVHYIEGGWPGSNERDIEYFEKIKNHRFKNARVAAFGSTRKAGAKCENDANLNKILKCNVPVVCLFGKSWDFHVSDALKTTTDENLKMIAETVSFMKQRHEEVIYDAEHFFDGFKANREYALRTLQAAAESNADFLVLCDTNGGTMPWEVEEITREVVNNFATPVGIHTHNDCEMAVANTMLAVRQGARMVQGTLNGYGERCGNSNLISVIANLKLKMGVDCVTESQLARLTDASREVNELAGLEAHTHQAFTGRSAFAHKGGVHVNALMKDKRTYEHIAPESVGNKTRILVSDLSGQANLKFKIKEFRIDPNSIRADLKKVLTRIKARENEGYAYEEAEASLELLLEEFKDESKNFFDVKSYRVLDERSANNSRVLTEATTVVELPDGDFKHEVSMGNGPVDALFKSLMKALCARYPVLKLLTLLDFKVRILNKLGTEAKTRVTIRFGDGDRTWTTVGVDDDVIEASLMALTDSIKYKLLKYS